MEGMIPSDVLHFITTYGGFAIFFMLALGIIGLPIPDETLLIFSGYLMSIGELSLITPLFVWCGSMVGITFSYALGVFGGRPLILRYGKWLHVTEEKLDLTARWFDKVGKWLLIIGYYLPGVRHLSGFIVGTVKVRYGEFALFAYTGAFLWSSTFMLIGYFFHSVTH